LCYESSKWLKNTEVPGSSGFLTTLFHYHSSKRQNRNCYSCEIHSARGQNKKCVQNFMWETLHVKESSRHTGVKAGITLVNIMAGFGKETSRSVKLGRIHIRAIHATSRKTQNLYGLPRHT
jgi:hypothetical protein